jgi:hypothetical protein
MHKQESGSSPIDNDPIDAWNNLVADTHIADSPIWHTPDGKEVICLVHFSTTNMNYKSFLVIVDTNAGSLEPIQTDAIGASRAVPPLLMEATTEKVLYPFRHPLCDKPIQTS